MRQSLIDPDCWICFWFSAFASVATAHHMTAQHYVFRSHKLLTPTSVQYIVPRHCFKKCESSECVYSFPRLILVGYVGGVSARTMTCG